VRPRPRRGTVAVMRGRYAGHVEEMERRIVAGPGAVDAALRAAAVIGASVGDPLMEGYLEKVRREAYAVTDHDLGALRSAGWTEEQIFELTVAAAFGAGRRRFVSGMGALREALATPSTAAERD
jgi:alkylhydroperoxidase family enzyme